MLLRLAFILLFLVLKPNTYASESIVSNNSVNFQQMLLELSSIDGLEELNVKTLVNEQDFDNFLQLVFKTPYVVPHFCQEFKSFQSTSIWNRPDNEIVKSCKEDLLQLLGPLLGGKYVLRTFLYSGEDDRGNFYKARLMAEDLKFQKSIVVDLELVLD